MSEELNAETVHRYFEYDPETGALRRRIRSGHQAAGTECRSQKGNGYFQVEFQGRNYLVHRVVWLIATGEWPTRHIDHIDGNRTNNRLNNLRDVSVFLNLQNLKGARKDNRLGLLGVSTDTRTGKFFSRIVVKKELKYLGRYDTPEAAHDAYITAKRHLHEGNTL